MSLSIMRPPGTWATKTPTTSSTTSTPLATCGRSSSMTAIAGPKRSVVPRPSDRNYETTWYMGNQNAYDVVHDQHAIGDVRKIVVHDGHRGPKEIGCSPAFLEWLTDPVLNGGGALTDFGCYGAD